MKVTVKPPEPKVTVRPPAEAAAPPGTMDADAEKTKVTVRVKKPVKAKTSEETYLEQLDEPTRNLQEGVRMAD